MFIDSLHLISVLAAHCPEAITEVCDDYIIVDTSICKDIIEELQNPFTMVIRAVDRIAYLPPPENEAETFEYPYVKTVKPSVHIARAHIKQDFKSSEIPALTIFIRDSLYRRVLRGRILLLYVFKTWMLYGRDYELG